MIKSIVKVLIAVMLANALWRVASAYISYYKFKDAVTEVAIYSSGKTTEQLRDKVMELAAMYDEPLAAEAVDIRLEEHHTYIDGTYTKPVVLLPGYVYQWPFALNVDGFVVVPPKFGDLANPK